MTPKNQPGSMLAVYRTRRTSRLPRFLILLVGLLLFMAVFVWGLSRLYFDYTHHGVSAALSWNAGWIAAGTLGVLIWLALTVPPLFQHHAAVYVFQNGLQLSGPKREEYVPWEKVTGIRVDSFASRTGPARTHHSVELTFAGRPALNLMDHGRGPWVIDGLADLISHIKARIYPRILPSLCSKISSGEWLVFGPVCIHAFEISWEGQRLPWKQVQRVSIDSGSLVVEWASPGKPAVRKKMPAYAVPNIELMLQIINQYAEG